VVDHGPGHWPGSAMPGRRGNAVFAGHRVTHDHPFMDLDLLAPGDKVIFDMAHGTFTYAITSDLHRAAEISTSSRRLRRRRSRCLRATRSTARSNGSSRRAGSSIRRFKPHPAANAVPTTAPAA
jgi:hypothetical protein